MGGNEEWAKTNSKRKAYFGSVRNVKSPLKKPHPVQGWQVKSDKRDENDILDTYSKDPLVVKTLTASFRVKRLLVFGSVVMSVCSWYNFNSFTLRFFFVLK
ncbi:hypothetical protein J1N35_019063 [Gossypium stocksii]|uniref:Uncharacterized protein n=1 Tax=Gossypium stocksii TaxID=47602 RepID=A0A9D3VQ51_9ROSI|nr:hypothetical protein J1N35_019063 [Gossypium stocksii]